MNTCQNARYYARHPTFYPRQSDPLTLGNKTVEKLPGTWIHTHPNLHNSFKTKTPAIMLLLLMKM